MLRVAAREVSVLSETNIELLTKDFQMTTMAQVRCRIESKEEGVPFTTSDFLDLGSRAAVDQSLSRVVRTGAIERIARGIFVRRSAVSSDRTKRLDPLAVVKALATASGETFEVHGSTATHYFGLSKGAPNKTVVFQTNGSPRHFQLGSLYMELRRVTTRKLVLAGRPAGLALSALWHLGKAQVNLKTLESIREKLGASEFEVLRKCRQVPGWLSDILLLHERGCPVG